MPALKIIEETPLYKSIPTIKAYPELKSVTCRFLLVILCCTLAALIPNIGQFLNLTGSIFGFTLTFLYPIMFYFKAYELRGKVVPNGERYFCYGLIGYAVVGCSFSCYLSIIAMLY